MKDVGGESWESWLDRMFEFESCDECGHDKQCHAPAMVLGHWFAVCTADDHGPCKGCK